MVKTAIVGIVVVLAVVGFTAAALLVRLWFTKRHSKRRLHEIDKQCFFRRREHPGKIYR